MEASRPLDEILANRRWVRHLDPFPYIVATDVFVPEVAEEVADAVRKTVEEGRGMSHFGWYDAFGWTFPTDLEGPLTLFTSRGWHDLVAAAAGVEVTAHVSGGIHNHAVGSKSGFVHHDLNPVYFPVTGKDKGDVQVTNPKLVDYMSGEVHRSGVQARKVVRAISLLYYTANEPWHPGDGGETGLYRSSADPVEEAAVRVPPINNSLVMFECTPNSFHTFLSNTRTVRNSVIMWLHRDYEEAAGRWGEGTLGLWSAKVLAHRAS